MGDPKKSDDVTIDFHSAEFNRIDDLSDLAGNYRSFETLDGVVTAHERHQIELQRKRDAAGLSTDGPGRLSVSGPKADETEASETIAPVTVASEGRTLIIDTDPDRARACARALRPHRLSCTMIITGSASAAATCSSSGRFRVLHANSTSVTGAFAGFSARVTVGGSEKPLTELLDDASVFDLVLDLQPVPSFEGGRLPTGYYAPGPCPDALKKALTELPEMRGQFRKPQFVAFYKDRCFHGRLRGLKDRSHDCRRCIEICPVGAIRSVDRKITISHSLCQGCAGCALVCPAEAFTTVHPSQRELLDSLQSALKSRSFDGSSRSGLVISDSTSVAKNGSLQSADRDQSIRFRVRTIGHVRLEVLLSALAYGAREVLVECDSQNPSAFREVIEHQVHMARAVLKGLNLEEERIRFLVTSPEDIIDLTKTTQQPAYVGEQVNDAPTAQMFIPANCDGRALARRAAQCLRDQSGGGQPWIPMPTGSPFGNVAVNQDTCTLCMACAGACPSGALFSGGNLPRLVFREFLCHQCGHCQETCPEAAIRLMPRLRLDNESTGDQTVVREAEPFRCVECGAPFAPPAMVDRMKQKLAGHWMYASERQLRRLQMCRTCRTRDALASGETGS